MLKAHIGAAFADNLAVPDDDTAERIIALNAIGTIVFSLLPLTLLGAVSLIIPLLIRHRTA